MDSKEQPSQSIKEPSRRRRRSPSSLTERARRIEGEIASLAAALARRLLGEGAALPRIDLHLDLAIDPDPPKGQPAFEPLFDQISRAVQQAGSRSDSVHSGHAYCYRCESGTCEHSAPPRPRAVFSGYGPTGQPLWSDLAQVLLDRKDPRVEDLFGQVTAILALVQLGRDLKGRQLHSFGRASKSYDVLGQVIAGYFGSRNEGVNGRQGLFAVTVQAVESRWANGRTRLSLNLLGSTPDSVAAAVHFAESGDTWFHEALHDGRQRLRQLEEELSAEPGARRRRSEILGKIPSILHRLRRAVEHADRQRRRRTLHAEQRKYDGDRPTQAALSDVWSASDAEIFFDEIRETLIVVGPHGRAHAFSSEGRHVTSLVLDGLSLERRLRRGRFRRATPEEIQHLRGALSPRPLQP